MKDTTTGGSPPKKMVFMGNSWLEVILAFASLILAVMVIATMHRLETEIRLRDADRQTYMSAHPELSELARLRKLYAMGMLTNGNTNLVHITNETPTESKP